MLFFSFIERSKESAGREKIKQSVLDETGETKGLVNEIEQQKLQFMGHIMRHRCTENDLLKGMVFGIRSRGRQKTGMTNTIKEKLGLTITEAFTATQDKEKWRNIVYATTAIREAEFCER